MNVFTITKVCAKTLCRYCKIVPVNDRKKIVWRNLFGLCFTHTERIFWLINSWKNRSSSSRKWRRKIFVLKKIDLFASQCTFSDSSRQAELKYIIPDQRKSFLRRVKVVIKTCPLPQTSQIWGKNLRRLHVFGNGHELFDALKDQSCVAWWRRWYFWTRHYLRTWHMC